MGVKVKGHESERGREVELRREILTMGGQR